MDQLAAKRYAKALLQIALEKDELNQYYDQVSLVKLYFDQNDDLLGVMCHPSITYDEKMQILENIFKNLVCDDIMGLFSVILKKNREDEILSILDSFIKMTDYHFKRVTAVVSSAITLSDDQINNIKANLSEKLKKQVEIKSEIDQSLIGGLKIVVDGMVFDASVKHRIETIKRELLQAQLV